MFNVVNERPRLVFLTPLPFMLIGAYGATHFPVHPLSEFVAIVFNLFMAAPCFWALSKVLDYKRCIKLIVSLSIFAWTIESLGIVTGFPYGAFRYGKGMGPLLFDTVPAILPLSYLPLILALLVLLPWNSLSKVQKVIFGSVFLTAFDLVLDPGATHLKYWIWPEGGIYYSVPISNFLGWLLSGAIASYILHSFLPQLPSKPSPLIASTFFWSLFFWTSVALLNAHWIAFATGLILLFYTWQKVLARKCNVQPS